MNRAAKIARNGDCKAISEHLTDSGNVASVSDCSSGPGVSSMDLDNGFTCFRPCFCRLFLGRAGWRKFFCALSCAHTVYWKLVFGSIQLSRKVVRG